MSLVMHPVSKFRTRFRKQWQITKRCCSITCQGYGVSTASIQPLASYADYVLSSSNAKLIAELIEGIKTKSVLRNGQVVTA